MARAPVSAMSAKRLEIQGLRCLAILAVIFFHLLPKLYCNGFLGVDVFFVLSGYLMSSILSREKSLAPSVLLGFYSRRFKRIVPLYSLMLLLLMAITPVIFLKSDLHHFVIDLEWALPFATNFQLITQKHDYWTEVFNSPVLLHAWSVAVEVQYYVVAPLVIASHWLFASSRRRIPWLIMQIGASLALHAFSSSMTSFALLFCRVWQFLIGSLAHEIEAVQCTLPVHRDQFSLLEEANNNSVKTEEKAKRCRRSSLLSAFNLAPLLASLLLLFLLSLPINVLSPLLLRLSSTSITAFLLVTDRTSGYSILKSRILCYIGDLSYVAYLAHWPVIVLTKYYLDVAELNCTQVFACLAHTLVISVLLHHSLESFFIRSSASVAFIFVGAIYGAIITVIHGGHLERYSAIAHKSVLYDEAISWNTNETDVIYYKRPGHFRDDTEALSWTNFTEEPDLRAIVHGNGTAKILLLGNSFGYRAFPLLLRLFAGRFKEFRMFTKSCCMELTENCDFLIPKADLILEKSRPDITFIIQYWGEKFYKEPVKQPVANDKLFQYAQKRLERISSLSRYVVLDYPYPMACCYESGPGVAIAISKRIVHGNFKFDDMVKTFANFTKERANVTARLDALSAPNLIRHDSGQDMCSETPGHCFLYNRRTLHAYYGDRASHLTSAGLQLQEKALSGIIEDLLTRLSG